MLLLHFSKVQNSKAERISRGKTFAKSMVAQWFWNKASLQPRFGAKFKGKKLDNTDMRRIFQTAPDDFLDREVSECQLVQAILY